MLKSIFYIIFLIMLISCKDEVSKTEYLSNEWVSKNKLKFSFNIKDKNPKDINLILRNNEDYPYQNLFIITELSNKKDKKFKITDTLEYSIFKPNGEWNGEGFGRTKELILAYKTNYQFDEMGDYELVIRQSMKKDTLKGVEDITFVLKNHANNGK